MKRLALAAAVMVMAVPSYALDVCSRERFQCSQLQWTAEVTLAPGEEADVNAPGLPYWLGRSIGEYPHVFVRTAQIESMDGGRGLLLIQSIADPEQTTRKAAPSGPVNFSAIPTGAQSAWNPGLVFNRPGTGLNLRVRNTDSSPQTYVVLVIAELYVGHR